jgi:hypothetical protein
MDCNWDHPGADPYWGKSAIEAIASYEFPKPVKQIILRKITDGKPDGVMEITYDRATWNDQYVELADMHWGSGKCKGLVKRSNWNYFRVEKALVYCGTVGHCIAVPFICGNVSRVVFGVIPPVPRVNLFPPRPEWEGTVPEPPTPAKTVPVPGTLALVVLALAAIAAVRKKP